MIWFQFGVEGDSPRALPTAERVRIEGWPQNWIGMEVSGGNLQSNNSGMQSWHGK